MTVAVTRKPLELVLRRVFDAPRSLVFEAWSNPDHMVRWWGPKGFTLPVCEMDFRTGGAFRLVMRASDGTEYPFEGAHARSFRPSGSCSPAWSTRATRRGPP